MKPPANDTRQDCIKHKNRTQMKTEKEKDVFQKLAKYIVEKEMFRDHRLNRDVLRNVEERDYIDSHREVSPLRKAADAIELDNGEMTIAEQKEWLMRLFRKAAQC